MPIYEYESLDALKGCENCSKGFEIYQKINDDELDSCPECGNPVKKIISWCRSAMIEISDKHKNVSKEIKNYEKAGMWSHAAELADKHSEKIKDKNLKNRALDNYKKAGYDTDSLNKHSKTNFD